MMNPAYKYCIRLMNVSVLVANRDIQYLHEIATKKAMMSYYIEQT